MNLLNQFADRNKRFIHELEWSDCSCSRVDNSLIQMIRLERVFSELNSQVKNREISWARATDAAKSKLLMSNFRINYCNWKSYLGQNCQLFVNQICCKGWLFKPTEMLECRRINSVSV